jgi:hypothetical protein
MESSPAWPAAGYKMLTSIIRCSFEKNGEIRKSLLWRIDAGSLEKPWSLLQLGQ